MIRLRPSGVDEILIKRVQDWYEPGPGVFITSTSTLFSPAMLFTGTTTGAWYDPSDTTTLYRDAAGTTPVTAVEQPVGLMLDKSKGLVLGPELVPNGTFPNITGWVSQTNVTISLDTNRLKVVPIAAAYELNNVVGYDITTVAGTWYRMTAEFSVSGIQLRQMTGGSFTGIATATFSSTSGTFYFLATGVSTRIGFRDTDTSGRTYFADNISVRELPGNHAFNSSGNSANFPVLKEDATGRKYLSFNGTNQWLQTNSIDFTYGNKMFVAAGVRKIGTSVSIPVELSANADTTAGTFNIGAPVAADLYYASLRGSSNLSAKQTPATFPSPITSVVQVSYALSQPSATDMSMRVNAVSQTLSVASSSPGPAGTGNYGNYPLYIGARAGSSLWFSGRLYQLVVAGKQASAAEITSTETYINQKTGAY